MQSKKEHFGGKKDLEYLFKVLSVNQPLSIQVHPNKAWGKILHENQPDIYKDSNHKPEMAIACTPFKALCGFRPAKEINEFLNTINVINHNAHEFFGLLVLKNSQDLKAVFGKLMEMSSEHIKAIIHSLITHEATPLKSLLTSLHSFFPYDRGCLCIYFLNYIEMQPGEAIFLEALTPHAYISGNCIECMAMSDNVIRAGLTPKHIDVKSLLEITNFKFSTENDFKVVPKAVTEFNKVYLPPSVNEFAVQILKLTRSHAEALSHDNYTRILLVIDGEIEVRHLDTSQLYSTGAVVFLYPNNDFIICSNVQKSFVYIAY